MTPPLTDAELLEYIERTPELKVVLEAVFLQACDMPLLPGGHRASIARAFHAHEQRILAQRGAEPAFWMQSDHLHALMNKRCGSQSMLARCSDHQLMPDFVPLYATPQPAVPEGKVLDGWIAGAPPKPWCDEWFIAKTTFGDRVVLKALPKEYNYDFKTADETYIKADKIVCWMQFPDSEYIAPQPAKPAEGVQEGVKSLERECDALTDRTIEQRRLIEDLASMCRRMSYALNRAGGSDTTVRQCIDLLKRHDLGGSIIRTEQVAKPAKPAEGGQEGPSANALLWNLHCLFQQGERGGEWESQLRELLASVEQHMQRVGYPEPTVAKPTDSGGGT